MVPPCTRERGPGFARSPAERENGPETPRAAGRTWGMISRSTLIGALVVVELVIVGAAARAIAGDGPASPVAATWNLPGDNVVSAPFFARTFVTGTEPHVVIDIHDVPLMVEAANVPSVQISETRRSTGWVSGESSTVSAQQTADGVRVSTSGEDIRHAVIGSYWREIRVVVPAAARIEVASAAQTTTKGLRGKLVARIPDGRIYITDQRGDVDVSTGSGRITMTDVEANDIAAHTSDGRIYLTHVGAERIDASSGSGRIVGIDVRAVNGAFRTADGRIQVSFTGNSDATVNAHTDDDNVDVSGLDKTSGDDSNATVQLGSGRGHFELRTASGPIILSHGANV